MANASADPEIACLLKNGDSNRFWRPGQQQRAQVVRFSLLAWLLLALVQHQFLPKRSTVVHEVPGQLQVCAIREVADVIHVALQRRRQWRARHVLIRTDRLGVVDRVASAIHGRPIWQVPNFVAKLLSGIRLRGLLEDEGLADLHGSSSALLPVERRCLNRRFASVPKLLFPSWVDLVSILLECQERPLELFVGLCILNDAIGQAHLSIRAGLPKLPCFLALATRRGALLRPILVPESAPARGQNDIGVAQILEERRQTQSVHASRDDGRSLLHTLP